MHRAVILPEQPLRDMQPVVWVNADQKGNQLGRKLPDRPHRAQPHGARRYSSGGTVAPVATIMGGGRVRAWREQEPILFQHGAGTLPKLAYASAAG